MSFRTWLYVFAFGIALAASVAAQVGDTSIEQQPVAETGQGDGSDENDEATQPDVTNSPDILTAIEGIESAIRDLIAEEDQIEAERQRQNESRDLNAQEAMAKWARWMFWATIGTALVTLVGLILIGFTLRYTRKAAEHTEGMLRQAERATIAAESAVEATRDIGEKQVRAYLHVTNVGFSLGEKTGEVGVRLTVANAGQSPAVAAKGLVVFEGDRKEPIVIEVPLPNIAASSCTTREIRQIKGKGSAAGLDGAKRITVFITVTAEDVFGHDIKAVSMRTIGIPNGAKAGQSYEPEDAEGFFPDRAIEFLAAGSGGFGPNKNKSGPKS